MLNEACMILEEKIVGSPEDLDLAMVMGTGFAPFTGGLLSYADWRGKSKHCPCLCSLTDRICPGIGDCVGTMKELAKKFGERFEPHKMLINMAQKHSRFFPTRPDPSELYFIPANECPRSRL